MEYLLLVWLDRSVDFKTGDSATLGPEVLAWVDEMDSRGIRVRGSALAPVRNARTIRVQGGETTVTEGLWQESNEFLAGFDVLQVSDADQAIEVASNHPVARFGRIELIPCQA